MKKVILSCSVLMGLACLFSEEITPHKYKKGEFPHLQRGYTTERTTYYEIPEEGKNYVVRSEEGAPDILYYMNRPDVDTFPIFIFLQPSSHINRLKSIIHHHRYLLEEVDALGAALVTLEQWGIDGDDIDDEVFFKHYSTLQRLKDHKRVIAHFKANPPKGWNGKFILLGISEGARVANVLAAEYDKDILAMVNWSGATDCAWRDELWEAVKSYKGCIHDRCLNYCVFCSEMMTREQYDKIMDEALEDPSPAKRFSDMGHYVINYRPDVIDMTFSWLAFYMNKDE